MIQRETQIVKQALKAIARQHFDVFCRKVFETLQPGTRFSPNWHIKAVAHHLELVRRGQITRLIGNLPPRSLKSIMASVAFPAWVLGHDPTKRIICVSYSAELGIKNANDFRTILKAPWYREMFPGTRVSGWKDTETEVVTTRGGYRLTTSVDGTLTGRGGDYIVIDDPLKSSDASSDLRRERANLWFGQTALSRLDNKRTGAIILFMQRLHINDMTGFLLRQAPEEWTHLSLPAIAEDDHAIKIGEDEFHTRLKGDFLHPEREGAAELRSMLAQLGSETFAAQYQQRPVPPGGAMVKRSWIRRYDRVPEPLASSQIIQSWDTASKDKHHNDYSACTTWLCQDGKYYLLDVLRGRFDYPSLKAKAIKYAQAQQADRVLIEDSGVGTALIAELNLARLTTSGVNPDLDKITRMSIQTAKFESGQVFFPVSAPWLPELEDELLSFPHSRHDDQVDSISQMLGYEISTYDPKAIAEGLARIVHGLSLFPMLR